MPKIRTLDRSCFCSELIAKVYEKCDMPLGVATQTFPMDLADLLAQDGTGWDDITDGIRRYLECGSPEELAAQKTRAKELLRSIEESYRLLLTSAERHADVLPQSAKIQEFLYASNLVARRELMQNLDEIERKLSSLSAIGWLLDRRNRERLRELARLRRKFPTDAN